LTIERYLVLLKNLSEYLVVSNYPPRPSHSVRRIPGTYFLILILESPGIVLVFQYTPRIPLEIGIHYTLAYKSIFWVGKREFSEATRLIVIRASYFLPAEGKMLESE